MKLHGSDVKLLAALVFVCCVTARSKGEFAPLRFDEGTQFPAPLKRPDFQMHNIRFPGFDAPVKRDGDESPSSGDDDKADADADSQAEGIGWNAWVDKKLGFMTCAKADAIVQILKVLEKERKAVSCGAVKGLDFSRFAVSDIDSMNDLLNAIVEKFDDFRYANCEAAYGRGDFITHIERMPSAGVLKITVNISRKDNPGEVRMLLARTMAQMRYEDLEENLQLGKEEKELWGDVCVACSGFGGSTLLSVDANRKFTDEGEERQLSYFGRMSPVETAWLHCIVSMLRGEDEPTEISGLTSAGKRAFMIGLHQAKVNLGRVKAQLASEAIPEWDDSLPEPLPEEPLPRRKIKRTAERRPMRNPPRREDLAPALESLKGKVAGMARQKGVANACLDLAKQESADSTARFVLLSEAMRILVAKGHLDRAQDLFYDELGTQGADYALALAESTLRNRRNLSRGKDGDELARWMAEIDEMKEANAFLKGQEPELDFLDATTFLRQEAAECYMIIHDEKNAFEELYRAEGFARKVLWTMGHRITATSQKTLKAGDVADFWWQYAEGKRPGVVAFCGRLSDKWYEKALSEKRRYAANWLEAAKNRIGKWRERQLGSKTKADAEFSKSVEPVGNSELLVTPLVGSWATHVPALNPLVMSSRRGRARQEVHLYRPRDYWLRRSWLGGWADAYGNAITVYRVRSIPLRDSDFGEKKENRPTREKLDETMDRSALRFEKPGWEDVKEWVAGLLELDKQEFRIVSVKTGRLRAAHVVLRKTDGRPDGVLLVTKGGNLYFAAMRFPTVVAVTARQLASEFIGNVQVLKFSNEGMTSPIQLSNGELLFPLPGYLVRTNLDSDKSKELVRELVREMHSVQELFQRYVPPHREMSVSTLRVFKDKGHYDSYARDELDHYNKNSIGLWAARREELLVLYDPRSFSSTMATVRHEGFHQYLFYATGRNGHAMWFNEGHACFFENGICQKAGGRLKYEISDAPSLRRTREVDAELQTVAGLMPEILYMDHEAFMSGTLHEVNCRYAAAWALVYFLQRAAPALPEYAAYREVVPAYLELMRKETMRAETASRKAWATVGTKTLSTDFLDFWTSPEKRAKARAYKP